MSQSSRERRTPGIAIIGLAGRFPGAPTVRDFWRNLTEGVESIAFASGEELSSAGVDPALIASPDFIRAGSSIREPEFFDAAFFGFSAREAEIIDPQQRVFLECAWEALEDAAYPPATFGGAIGVFAGAGMNTYGLVNLLSNPELIQSVGAYQVMVGNDKDFLCSRTSYKLNLRGPSVGVQTACSTSLVAVQMAFESLLRQECDMALAGGVSISFPPALGYSYVPGMILSRDGHCRPFDAAASGTVPGAGAGIAVLKRLEDAVADGDHIYAVIRGAAINNDGSAKVGYSAPSVDGQTGAIQKSMRMAGFAPESVTYVEAHGTGTEVGDPIEVAALAGAFASGSTRPQSCVLGAVKSNIGHLDTAAGIAGLIKASLSLKHRTIPPTLHFTQANPLIDFSSTPFYVSSVPVAYNEPGPFRAGVSSFGIGGTNAHVSLEEAPPVESDPQVGSQLIVLSAKSASALDKQSAQLVRYLDENPSANLADLAFTLQKGRQPFQHRRVLIAGDAVSLKTELQTPRTQSQQLRTDSAPSAPAEVAFLFPGQGSQYVNMGRGLYNSVPVFRDTVDRCCRILQPLLGRDLKTILYPAPGEEKEAERLLGQTAITQPALFVIEYAMAATWMDCGLQPSAMIGHSVGEYVAACLAGVFTLEDGLALIAARGKIIQSVPPGTMLAVSLSEQDLEPLLSPHVSVAAINAPGQAVASGAEVDIAALEATLKSKKIECRRLRTSHAFHSPMMDGIVEQFIRLVARVQLSPPSIRYLSNVTGTWIAGSQPTDPGYWGSHLRNTVRFADCGRNLMRDFDGPLLEVGPGDTLLSLLRRQLEPRSPKPLVSSMRHPLAQQDDRDTWLTAAGRLWLSNVHLDWDGLHRGERRVRLSLPTYPFERQRYWVEPRKAKTAARETVKLEKQPDIADWFYVPSWKRGVAELLPQSEIKESDTWLLLAEDGPLADALVKKLGARGNVARVRTAAEFRQVSPELYEVNPASREDYYRLLQGLQSQERWPDRIVHAWMPDSIRESNLDKVLDRGVISAMFLVQAVEESSPTRAVEFNVISDRAYSILGEPVSSPAPSALNAFCGVIALECPNISSRVIDIDFTSNPDVAGRQLGNELVSTAANEIVAYRGSARWIQHYAPARLGELPEAINAVQKANPPVAIRSGGTYLITGGLGGVGLVFARHLARRAGAQIVLTSRSPFPPASEWQALLDAPDTAGAMKRKIEGARSVEKAGGKVLVVTADTIDRAAMRQALAVVHAQFGPISGVIHGAGLAGAGLMQAKSREQACAVLAPKIQGSEWIRELLAVRDNGARQLDFVLLCSSISAVIPSFGLSDYAAANAYLDGFAAAFDDPSGTRVLSANFDTWREVGMAVDTPLPPALAHLREDRLKHGILSLEAVEVFDRLLNFPLQQVVVSTRDFNVLQSQTAETIANMRATLHSPDRGEPLTVHTRPESMENFTAAEDEVEQFIVNVWQELLGVEPIGIHDNFFGLGGHSLLGTQVLARIRERFKVSLSLRTIFEAATPADLAQHVRVLGWASADASSASVMEREEIEI